MRKKKLILIAPLAILGILAVAALGGWIVQLLWNWLLPPLFGWRILTIWQALGLLVLCRILFGGWGGSGPRSNVSRRMRDRMDERWEKMSPEERERLRQGMRERCGFHDETATGQANP
ncbi:MAG TPA: hypothetical protein VMU45_04745 [Candidatus Eisenbacteria bacterium]|nr:hypothetical protein [Candidatus Eisenbacteria bacterium]